MDASGVDGICFVRVAKTCAGTAGPEHSVACEDCSKVAKMDEWLRGKDLYNNSCKVQLGDQKFCMVKTCWQFIPKRKNWNFCTLCQRELIEKHKREHPPLPLPAITREEAREASPRTRRVSRSRSRYNHGGSLAGSVAVEVVRSRATRSGSVAAEVVRSCVTRSGSVAAEVVSGSESPVPARGPRPPMFPPDPQALLRSDVRDLRKHVNNLRWRLTCMVDDVEAIDHGLGYIERGLGLQDDFQWSAARCCSMALKMYVPWIRWP